MRIEIPAHLRITIEPDRRYRVLVTFGRSDRPRYWTFHCPNCQKPLCEIVNADIQTMTDVIDMSNLENIGNGVRCDGRFQGRRCDIWYYFNLNPN